jgi:hypothetical protein
MDLLGRFIFFPERRIEATPADYALPYEDVRFPAADGVMLHGWWVPGRGPDALLWLHGNAGNISHRLDNLRLLHDAVGCHTLLFDYRGYGLSDGTPTEAGLYADARGALAWLRARPEVSASRIVYFGRSLGSAVAVELATHRAPRALILETPFTSTREMASAILPEPLAVFVPTRFDSLARIPTISSPLLVIHGDQDEIVPYELGRRLYDAATAPKSFLTIEGASHNDTYVVGAEGYFRGLREFLAQLDDAR